MNLEKEAARATNLLKILQSYLGAARMLGSSQREAKKKAINIIRHRTGIDVEKEILSAGQALPKTFMTQAIERFVCEKCDSEKTLEIGATELYQAFCVWFSTEHRDRLQPTQKKFGLTIARIGYCRRKQSTYFYEGIALKQTNHDS